MRRRRSYIRPDPDPDPDPGSAAAGVQDGASLRTIVETLNEAQVPTAHGGARWHASTVRAVLVSAHG